jgi:hypothetical protein
MKNTLFKHAHAHTHTHTHTHTTLKLYIMRREILNYILVCRQVENVEDTLIVDVGHVACEAAQTCRYIPTFRRNIRPPYSALKMKAVCSSET